MAKLHNDNQFTSDVLMWCQSVEEGGVEPEIAASQAETKILMGVLNSYADLLADHEKFGEPFSDVQRSAMQAVQQELTRRGLFSIDASVSDLVEGAETTQTRQHRNLQ